MAEEDKWKMTSEQMAAAKKWLDDHLVGELQCQICKTNNWSICEDLANIDILTPGVRMIGGVPSYPQVQLICVNCGMTIFFNAVLSKVHPPNVEKPNG